MAPSFQEAAVTHEELQEFEPERDEDFDDEVDEVDDADDWDEETLGLDWNEADERTLVRDVVPDREWANWGATCRANGPAGRLRFHAEQLEGRHRLQEAAQRERADLLHLGDVADLALHLRIDDDLPAARLAAQARGQVRHVADR